MDGGWMVDGWWMVDGSSGPFWELKEALLRGREGPGGGSAPPKAGTSWAFAPKNVELRVAHMSTILRPALLACHRRI